MFSASHDAALRYQTALILATPNATDDPARKTTISELPNHV